MPYSNYIPTTPAGLTTISNYLADAAHCHHEEYELTPIEILGAASVFEFITSTEAAYHANQRKLGRLRVGRQPKNAANWFVVRTPDGTWLTDDERNAYEAAALVEAGYGSPVLGLMNWHKNKLSGAPDLNLLAASFSASGELLRDRTANPIKSLRHRMDRVTKDLNVLREKFSFPLIQTMTEAQQNVWEQRETFVIEEELARMPKPPRKAADLKPALLSLGCEVPRFEIDRDTVCITKPKKKKAKRYGIIELLRLVEARIQKREIDLKAPEPAETSSTAPTLPSIRPLDTSQTPPARLQQKSEKKNTSELEIAE
jgi:hypothetical protein